MAVSNWIGLRGATKSLAASATMFAVTALLSALFAAIVEPAWPLARTLLLAPVATAAFCRLLFLPLA